VFQNPLSGTASELSILDNFRLAAIRTQTKGLTIGINDAWRTALVASAANAVLLALRIRHEERALADAEGAGRIEPAPSRAKLTRRPVAR
jgi:ABC-type uncharacterized transport system ATPase component